MVFSCAHYATTMWNLVEASCFRSKPLNALCKTVEQLAHDLCASGANVLHKDEDGTMLPELVF